MTDGDESDDVSGLSVDVTCEADDAREDLEDLVEKFEAMADAAEDLDAAMRRLESRNISVTFDVETRGLGPGIPEDTQ